MSTIDGPGLKGLRLAAEEINAKGGVLGDRLEIIAHDGKSDQTEVTNAATHPGALGAARRGQLGILGGYLS